MVLLFLTYNCSTFEYILIHHYSSIFIVNFDNEEDITEFVKCKLESLVANTTTDQVIQQGRCDIVKEVIDFNMQQITSTTVKSI